MVHFLIRGANSLGQSFLLCPKCKSVSSSFCHRRSESIAIVKHDSLLSNVIRRFNKDIMLPPSRHPLKPRGEMVMVGQYTDYLRRCRSSFIQCIPDEVLFEIMLRLLAQDIYFGARLVCRKWYHMMRSRNFIRKHLERASSGLLCMDDSKNYVFISAREDGGVETYKLNIMITDPDWDREMEKKISKKYKVTCKIVTSHQVRYPVLSSWNGLVLESDPHPYNISCYKHFDRPSFSSPWMSLCRGLLCVELHRV